MLLTVSSFYCWLDLKAKYVIVANVGPLSVRPFVVRSVVISRKLSNIDP